jgi:hypothetical protein
VNRFESVAAATAAADLYLNCAILVHLASFLRSLVSMSLCWLNRLHPRKKIKKKIVLRRAYTHILDTHA